MMMTESDICEIDNNNDDNHNDRNSYNVNDDVYKTTTKTIGMTDTV